ncbi:MAG: helix-turn-helix domain-containing protein [Clostridia bacterium]|nr:helix-turn-helix domain-containing protein [Clostridia bacterium]
MSEDISRVPWGMHPSLKDRTNELGIDFDGFIEGLKNNLDDSRIARELGTTEKAITSLRKHFEEFGIQSIVGRD